MSKAFQCDNCGDLFPGDAHKVLENGAEVCSGCFRSIKALSTVDCFTTVRVKLRTDNAENWEPREWPLHTGRHSQ